MGQLHWQGASEAKEEREREKKRERKTKEILKYMYFGALQDSGREREKTRGK